MSLFFSAQLWLLSFTVPSQLIVLCEFLLLGCLSHGFPMDIFAKCHQPSNLSSKLFSSPKWRNQHVSMDLTIFLAIYFLGIWGLLLGGRSLFNVLGFFEGETFFYECGDSFSFSLAIPPYPFIFITPFLSYPYAFDVSDFVLMVWKCNLVCMGGNSGRGLEGSKV